MDILRNTKIFGRSDAIAILMIIVSMLLTSPLFFNEYYLLGLIVLLSFSGAVLIFKKKAAAKFDPIDEFRDENFVLESDDVYDGEGYVLGFTKGFFKKIILPFHLFYRHIGVVGASGVGKTTFAKWILHQHLNMGGGALFLNGKVDADARDELAYLAKAAGREDDLYILDLSKPEDGNTYSPTYGRKDADEIMSTLLYLLAATEDAPAADFYKSTSGQAILTIVGALKASNLAYTLNDLSILMQSSMALEWLLRQCPEGDEKANLDIFLEKYRVKQGGTVSIDMDKMKDVLGGIVAKLAVFTQGKFKKMMAHYNPEVVIDEIIQGDKILYVSLPTMGKEESALTFAKMFLSDLASSTSYLQENPQFQPKVPFLVFPDEMGSYVIKKLGIFFEQSRSAKVVWMPSFQTFGNLAKLSKEFLDTVMQSTWTKVIFRFGSIDSSTIGADLIGSITKLQVHVSESDSSTKNTQYVRLDPDHMAMEGAGESIQLRETKEHRVTPEKLQALGIGECIIKIGHRTYHALVPELIIPIKVKRGEHEYKAMKRKPRKMNGLKPCNLYRDYQKFLHGIV